MASSGQTARRRGGSLRLLRDIAIIIVAALIASFLVRSYLVRSFYIPSASMENTLLIGDRVVVNELVPGVVPLQRGDVIVFKDPGGWLSAGEGNDLIKRVIGLPGDHVSCCGTTGQLSVNGHTVPEPYVVVPAGTNRVSSTNFQVTVPQGKLWVMGDNRYDSADSRMHGFVPVSDVVGRAFVITWPVSRWNLLSRYPASWDAVPKP
ncbi:signal peptidase I [Curtobacterium ammoniigenes]|uniref:signal peptidase I n=1 Tax=Curtobacterium ammoniigenes TaxID=395387 RepID=UPI00082DCB04|nr:signal peptidase I [Curtobacterium ammoniigenes]